MMSKKIISLLLSVLMLVSVLSVSAFAMEAETLEAERSGTITVSASAASVQVGDTFTVTVGVTVEQIAALKIDFAYDESVLKLVKVNEGITLNPYANLLVNGTVVSSSYGLLWSTLGNESTKMDLNGNFAVLTFQTLAASEVAMVEVSASGGSYNSQSPQEFKISFEDASASVKITAAGGTDPVEPTPEPTVIILGDANGDGFADSMDAALILQYEVGMDTGYAIDQPIAN